VDECESSLVIQWYEALEERLMAFLRFVPPVPENLAVHSYVLAGIIIEACGVLDSLFRRASEGKVTAPEDLDITHYADMYGLSLGLPSASSLILVSPVQPKVPFTAWQVLPRYEPMPWWTAHTKLKHDRIRNIRLATLTNALDSMCGLHQVIARLPEMASAKLRDRWVNAEGWNPEVLIEQLKAGNRDVIGRSIVVESELFAVPVGPYQFPSDLRRIDSASFVCSQRLLQFLGAW
jgi:hypothetical protein